MNRFLFILFAALLFTMALPGCDPRAEDYIPSETIPLPDEDSIVGAPKRR